MGGRCEAGRCDVGRCEGAGGSGGSGAAASDPTTLGALVCGLSASARLERGPGGSDWLAPIV